MTEREYDKPQRVSLAGGTAWVGLMLTVLAVQSCQINQNLGEISQSLKKQAVIQQPASGR